jgi:hypothetical protein
MRVTKYCAESGKKSVDMGVWVAILRGSRRSRKTMHPAPEQPTALPRESSAALTPANPAAGEGGGLFRRFDMSTCPHCGHQHASVDQKLRSLFAARVGMAAKVNRRSDAASTNELATEIRAAEDVIDPRSAFGEPRRAVGFIEFKVGEEPERFDEAWDGGVK